jgi:hypothetical protein
MEYHPGYGDTCRSRDRARNRHCWVIRHEGGNLQLKPGSRRYGPTQSKALACEWEDGTMEV